MRDLRVATSALVLLAVAVAGCGDSSEPAALLPEAVQRNLPRNPPGTLIENLCPIGRFSQRTIAQFRRRGRRQLRALKEAYRRYPDRGVVVRYETEEEPGVRQRDVWTVSELVDVEREARLDPAEDIDDRSAAEVLTRCERRYLTELEALKRVPSANH